MKLIASTTSPFARKVTMLLHEKAALDSVEVVYVDPWSAPDALTALNPLSQVPTLVLDDHRVLIDSDVIGEYLDRHLPGTRLIPESGDAYWHVRVVESLANGLLEASVAVFLETERRPERLRWEQWIEFQRTTMGRTLDAFEDLAPRLAEDFDYAAICGISALGHLEFRCTAGDWRRDRPRLAAWFEGLQQRSSVRDTLPVETAPS
jgi:glutathione S-transferase